ncbi:MAG TPA: hypothetical protein VLH15_00010 [Dehalococcoidales bacterium]|nr:hypothetical protein [Dehalococcoidales bacterium]
MEVRGHRSEESEKPIELLFHDVHSHGVKIAELWIKEVEKRSGGRVRFTSHTGGGPAMTEKADVVRDVPAGGGQYPLLDLIQIPLLFKDSINASQVLAQLYSEFPELRHEISDKKIVGLSIGALMAIFTSQKWGPVETLEALRGARIRSLAPIDGALKSLGAEPRHVDYLKIAPLLAAGELDAAVLGLLPARIFELAEKGAPFCTIAGEYSITAHPMRLYMKWDSWNKLPAGVRDLIDELGPAGQTGWFASQSGTDSDNALKGAMEYFRQKGRIIRLPVDELNRWLKAMELSRQSAIELAEAQGQPGRRFFARMKQLIQELQPEQ